MASVFSYLLISYQSNDIMLIHNSVFIMFFLHLFWEFHHTYVHSKGHNSVLVWLVPHISRQFHHTWIQLKVSKSMFHFMHQISYISKMHLLLNQSYFHSCLLLCFYFDHIDHFEFQFLIMFYFNILFLQLEFSYHLCNSNHY